MERDKQIFQISFKELLGDVVASLSFPGPVYNRLDVEKNSAYVVVRKKTGAASFYFEGQESNTLVESEEAAAERAVKFLAKKYRIQILDISLERRRVYQSCHDAYKSRASDLIRLHKGKCKIESPTANNPKSQKFENTVPINFSILLSDILRKLELPSTAVECMHLEGGGHICTFSLGVDQPRIGRKVEWLLGDICETVRDAEQSLARKTIKLLQPIYGFDVKDFNYTGMMLAKLHCDFERERYLTIIEKIRRAGRLDLLPPLLQRADCDNSASVGSNAEDTGCTSQCLPPKKRGAHFQLE